MSLARLYHTKKSRKVWHCSKCGREIPVGSPVIGFAVGFRGFEMKRCGDNPKCYPRPSERESSAVATVYAALEGIDLEGCNTLEELREAVEEVASACHEVADEYEANEMYEINYDLQERADMIRSAGEELESWESGIEDDDIETQRQAARDAIDGMELP